jgi:hypothetical protein
MRTKKPDESSVAIGLRAKTGRAIAVILGGRLDAPHALKRIELKIADPAFPATIQPYHEVMDLPWDKAQSAARKIAARIEKRASKELARLVKEAKTEGQNILGVGIVGAGDRNLDKIGSPHIRAHAAEGVLFREVLEVASATNDLSNRRYDERTLDAAAETELKLTSAKIKAQLAEMGRIVGSPWRADEKAAATAAWLALAAFRK